MERGSKFPRRVPRPSSSQSRVPGLIHQVQAVLKRSRPSAGHVPPNAPRARRLLSPDLEPRITPNSTAPMKSHITPSEKLFPSEILRHGMENPAGKKLLERMPDDSLHSPPSITETITDSHEDDGDVGHRMMDGMPEVHDSHLQKDNDQVSACVAALVELSSHMDSITLANDDHSAGGKMCVEVEVDRSKQSGVQQNNVSCLRGSDVNKQSTKIVQGVALQNKYVTGTSSTTMTSVHSTTAPVSTLTGKPHSNMGLRTHEEFKLYPSTSAVSALQSSCVASTKQTFVSTQVSGPTPEASLNDHDQNHLTVQESVTGGIQSSNAIQTDGEISTKQVDTVKVSKNEKGTSDKAISAPHKKNYDHDMFFKVNGKLYQKLGKIGSGGSSEVYKVISSDCTIYALKKIKLKGRDYATALGFYQEIEYLNKLKGKNNIIQLVDYEVTDKRLLEELTNGMATIKDIRIKDDGYIYMVLEYGEIDLAHMLSQKWKDAGHSSMQIDENWLRFYWQQMLLAVNTIHEERIVHSDLKPANFLLVRGSLKLIDFGIAKAIMSDTTNIQRDAQVGTLNYMAPEAFMWNEQDDSGNIIKCGRPSDIWSLGCILYQMVYGRTPFSEYRTFWAKFKVITDRQHQIRFDPISNPWLLDLMKKCLAWERDERWRISLLLQHPFIVPPVPSQQISRDNHCKMLLEMATSYGNNPNISNQFMELYNLLLA